MSRVPRMVWMDVTLWLDREGELKLQRSSLPKLHNGSVLRVTRTHWPCLVVNDGDHVELIDSAAVISALSRQLVTRAVAELSAWMASGGPVDVAAPNAQPQGSVSRAPVCLWLHVWNASTIGHLVCSTAPWLIRHWAGPLYQVEAQPSSSADVSPSIRPLNDVSGVVMDQSRKSPRLRLCGRACHHHDARRAPHPTAHAQGVSPAPRRARRRPRVRSTGVRSNDTSCPGATGTAEELQTCLHPMPNTSP